MKACLIYGKGGHALTIEALARKSDYEVVAFFDDNADVNDRYMGREVLRYKTALMREYPLVIAIGNNVIRKKIVSFVAHKYCTFIDNTAFITQHVRIGEGTVVMPGAIVQAGADIGRHVILNIGCAVDHEVSIGDFAHIGPKCYIGGGAIIGEGATIGAGSVIMRNAKIADWTDIPPLSVIT
jgi:acetyltransferase EpsM